jgi:predicted transcriptional regulator
MIYRSRIRIVADILETTKKEKEGATRTGIMYGVNLSYGQLCLYVLGMKEAGLLVENPANNKPSVKALYTVTDEGNRFLKESPFILGKLEIIEETMQNIKKSKMNKDR